MEFGNVYEVLQTGDIVNVKDISSIYCDNIGVIVTIDNPGCYIDPIYTVKFDEPYSPKIFKAKDLKKVGHVAHGGTDEMKNVDVKKIIFSGPKTIVLWSDGTKTIVSMSKDETNFDPEAAFCAAYTKKMFGTNSKIKRIIKEKSNIEQYDGMCIKCRPFRWSDLGNLDNIFRTRKDAETEFERRTKENTNVKN